MQNIILSKNDFFIYISSFFQLMKPRVMSLVIFTCVVGLLIAPEYNNLHNSIISILAENKAISLENITAAGRGEYSPVDSNDTNEGKAKNRRIEVVLTPKLDEISKLLNKN